MNGRAEVAPPVPGGDEGVPFRSEPRSRVDQYRLVFLLMLLLLLLLLLQAHPLQGRHVCRVGGACGGIRGKVRR